MLAIQPPEPGEIVELRQRRWVVDSVSASALPTDGLHPAMPAQHLLRAEVWAGERRRKLHRVSARRVPAHLLGEPVVIAHGRIVVLGADNQRLHEEITAAGCYLRAGRFTRLEAVGRVDELLAAAGDGPVPEPVRARLAGLWEQRRVPLLRALEARMRDRTRNLQGALDRRRGCFRWR